MKKITLALSMIILGTSVSATAEYTLKLLTGNQLRSIIPFMVEQRISAFRDYPYLYEGNSDEETEYAQWFTSLPHSVAAIAYHDGKPVGFVSGTGFADFDVHFKGSIELFEKNGLDPKKFYYIPEAIIMPEHRRKSLMLKLHALVIEHAQTLGYLSSCLVEESHDMHPLKPADYTSRDDIYLKAGYTKTSMIIKFPWLTIQADESLKDEEHELLYWIMNLN